MRNTRILSLIYLLLNTCTQTSAYSFVGKRALVTGSSGRVGSAIAKELARRGAHVLIHYNTKYEAARLTNQYILESGGACDGIVQCDFTKPGDILQMMRIVDQIWGGQLDILVNGAECVTRLAAEDDNERITAWRKTIQVNLNAPFKLARLAHERMRRQQDGGVIVNLSSNHQSKNLEYMTAFAASKAGLDRMTTGLSNEWSRDRVRVNAVSPTFSLNGSGRYLQSSSSYGNQRSAQSSYGSNGANGSTSSTERNRSSSYSGGASVENIANSVLYLCESEYTTGSVLTVDARNAQKFRPKSVGSTVSSYGTRMRSTAGSSSDVSRFEGFGPYQPQYQRQYQAQYQPRVPGAGVYSQNYRQNNSYGQNGVYRQDNNYNNAYGQYGQNSAYGQYGQNNVYRQTAPHYSSTQRGGFNNRGASFDNNGRSPTRTRMENYRDGTERFGNYAVRRGPGAGQRWDTNTLDRSNPMENYRTGTGKESIRTYGDNPYPKNPNTPFATRPPKRKTNNYANYNGSLNGDTYSRTSSYSQNFVNGDPRYQNYGYGYDAPRPLIGTRPRKVETNRREMNQVSRFMHNGETNVSDYSTYPEPEYRYRAATRPKPDPKYPQVTRYLNGQTPTPLVDPTRPNGSTSSTYMNNRLPGYVDEKRYGGTTEEL